MTESDCGNGIISEYIGVALADGVIRSLEGVADDRNVTLGKIIRDVTCDSLDYPFHQRDCVRVRGAKIIKVALDLDTSYEVHQMVERMSGVRSSIVGSLITKHAKRLGYV